MPRYIGFLRAVNVGGRYVKMEALRQALIEGGFTDVQTHIQSGNVHVASSMRRSERVAAAMSECLSACAGFAIPAIVRTPAELVEIANYSATAPVPAGLGDDPAQVQAVRRYVTFFDRAVGEDAQAKFESWEAPGERARVDGRELHLWLCVPFYDVSLTGARIERISGATSTTRDAKVVAAIAHKWG